MIKQTKLHHSVSELGNLQLRQVVEYVNDKGEIVERKYSESVTPADPKNMTGWDSKSKDIVSTILDPEVQTALEIEKQLIIGTGIEEITTYDRVISEDAQISIRKIIRIYDEGIEVSKKYYRSRISPGDNPAGKDVISEAMAKKLHTTEVIDAYEAKWVT